MASSFTYAGHSYPDSYSSDGKWWVQFKLNFSHISPTDGSYNYKIRYWCHEASDNQPTPFETGVLLSESSGQHSAQQTHVLTVSRWLTAGSTYYFNAELWYQANDGEWHASALGMVGRQTINVKAADDGTIVDPPNPDPEADISVQTTEIRSRSVKFRGIVEPFPNQSYYYRVLIYISTSSSVDIDNYQYFVSSDYSYSSGSNLTFSNIVWNNGTQPGQRYYWKAYIGYNTSNSGSGWYYSDVYDSGNFTTSALPTGTISQVATGPFADHADLQWRWTPGQSYQTSGYEYTWQVIYSTEQNLSPYYEKHNWSAISGSSTPCTLSTSLTGLAGNLTYYYKITMYGAAAGGTQEEIATYQGQFLTPPNEITRDLLQWSWSKASGSWNNQYSQNSMTLHDNALYAITHNGPTTDFDHKIWNDLIEWIVYNLDTLDVNYSSGTVSSASMSSTSTTLTASRWNCLALLCNNLLSALESSNRIDSHNSNDYCNGAAFTTVVNTVNNAIAAYNNGGSERD